MSLDRRRITKSHGATCWGTGLIALDIVEAEAQEFAATGGSCGNVLAILSWFGWSSLPIGRFGNDVAAEFVRSELRDLGVDTSFISVEPRVDTPIVIQRFAKDGAGRRVHRFSLSCPECGAWLPRHRPITLKQAESVVAAKRSPEVFYFDRVSPGAIRLAELASERGALIVFEPASAGDESKFRRAVDLCHVLKYSKERLGAIPDLAIATSPILVIETQGEAGLRFRWRNHWTHLDAIKLDQQTIDAAGSGDWCTAALIHGIGGSGIVGLTKLSDKALIDALRTGQALASINCRYLGARGAMMVQSLKELNRQLRHIFDSGSLIVEPSSKVTVGAEPPEFCRRCDANTPLEREVRSRRSAASE